MNKLLLTYKKQLLFAVTICLLISLLMTVGKIAISCVDINNKVDDEQFAWFNIIENIKPELPLIQRSKWTNLYQRNPKLFIEANTSLFQKSSAVPPCAHKNRSDNKLNNLVANLIIPENEKN